MSVIDDFYLSELPFCNLSNTEFYSLLSNVNLNNPLYDLNAVLGERDIQSSHDSNFEEIPEANLLGYENKSQYITTEEISCLSTSHDSLTLLQINCRSLKKNHDQLLNLLNQF